MMVSAVGDAARAALRGPIVAAGHAPEGALSKLRGFEQFGHGRIVVAAGAVAETFSSNKMGLATGLVWGTGGKAASSSFAAAVVIPIWFRETGVAIDADAEPYVRRHETLIREI